MAHSSRLTKRGFHQHSLQNESSRPPCYDLVPQASDILPFSGRHPALCVVTDTAAGVYCPCFNPSKDCRPVVLGTNYSELEWFLPHEGYGCRLRFRVKYAQNGHVSVKPNHLFLRPSLPPSPGALLSRHPGTIKDAVTRYAHQSGHYVSRRAGWDCHGLPVEYEIDQSLKITHRDQVFMYTFTYASNFLTHVRPVAFAVRCVSKLSQHEREAVPNERLSTLWESVFGVLN